MKIEVQKVGNTDLVFGGDMEKLLPKYDEIPKEFKNGNTKWNRVFNDWFFNGIENCKWIPKDNIDPDDAIRHVMAVMRSFEPKHEHKEAGCAYLLSEFFDDVTYEKIKGEI